MAADEDDKKKGKRLQKKDKSATCLHSQYRQLEKEKEKWRCREIEKSMKKVLAYLNKTDKEMTQKEE